MIHTVLIILYYILNLLILLGLSIYDYKHLKINKPLFYAYIPISLLSLYPNLVLTNYNIRYVLIMCVASALILFVAFFAVAFLTNNKLGGGDVKLIPFVGFAFGLIPVTMLLAMVASLLILVSVTAIYNTVAKKKGISEEDRKKARINGPHPAIPYMFIGCVAASLQIIFQYVL